MNARKPSCPDAGQPETSRRDFLKTAAGSLAAAGAMGLMPGLSTAMGKNRFGGLAFADEPPAYEVYALKYGEMQNIPNILWHWLGNPALAAEQPVTPKGAYYWLIKGRDTNILFDAGYTPEAAGPNHIVGYEDHATVLGKLGLKLEDIDAVVISHAHGDHMNGAQAFQEHEKCLFYIQEACFVWSVEVYPRYPLLKKVDLPHWKDIQWLSQQLYLDRLKLVPGKRGGKAIDLFPGVSVRRVDGHMTGLQIAVVQTANGPTVLTSDAAYLYSNLEMDWPVGLIMGSLTDAMDGLNTCRQSGEILVPGHDMAVGQRFPEVKSGVYRIA